MISSTSFSGTRRSFAASRATRLASTSKAACKVARSVCGIEIDILAAPLCVRWLFQFYGRTIRNGSRDKTNWLVSRSVGAEILENPSYTFRTWLWGCHDRVNAMNQKKSPPSAALPEMYPKQSIEKPVRELFGMFQQAMSAQQLKSEDVAKWKKSLAMLRNMYGI